eukprot:2542571-Heterocapsa_arctica.AAC.1
MEVLDKEMKPEAYLEIGATPTLLNMVKRFTSRKEVECVSSMDKGTEVETFKKALTAVGSTPPRATDEFKRTPFPWRD